MKKLNFHVVGEYLDAQRDPFTKKILVEIVLDQHFTKIFPTQITKYFEQEFRHTSK
jgi:hypothetical protein